ncbi:MAG: deoxyguanosinetriphosphate triphosphohydrolase [Flavobacteriaceae bacterium]|nr:deoxyguanosinetriphosphate triphosphohydrolase [Flavobacteriaceae bacterium]
MNWEQLLSLKRFGDTKQRLRKDQDETRLGFEVDYDRIIFSNSFRSLQDKTQVVPLSKTDFVHTRLTHSLEVSVVARSLGRVVGKALLDKHPILREQAYKVNDFGAIVASAALAHDIGNPPFGHAGEKAIGDYFASGKGRQYKTQLSDKEWQDLIDFEGNANGFKILTESHEGKVGGIRLSYATLGAFMKYPKESLPKKPTTNIADKKYGVFQSESIFFKELTADLGLDYYEKKALKYYRHPLAFLVEAADDICYTIIDFEDGINLGLIEEEYALEYLINLVRDSIDTKKYYALPNKSSRLSYLRALAIGALINEATKQFLDNEAAILKGVFDRALLDKCKYEAQINDIIKISIAKIYKSKEVVEKEISGYRVIADLLDCFSKAAINKLNKTQTNYDKLLLQLMPDQFKEKITSPYQTLISTCGFVASLSDSQALLLHKKISGFLV